MLNLQILSQYYRLTQLLSIDLSLPNWLSNIIYRPVKYRVSMFLFFQKSASGFVLSKRFFLICSTLALLFLFSQINFAQEEDEAEETAQAAAVANFNKGQDAHEKRDFSTALKFYDAAVKLAPEFPEAEFQRGNALLSLNKPDDAEKAFRRAIELREDWTLPMASLGNLLIAKSNFAEAETILTKAVALDANNFPALAALTELRLKSKAAPEKLRELLAQIKSLTVKANPTASIWAAQGAIETALGDKVSAKKSLSNALNLEPKNIFALQTRTTVSLAESDFVKALNDAQLLVQISPNSIDAKVLLARVYAESGDKNAATKILDALDSANPNVAALRNAIAKSGSVNAAELETELAKDQQNAAILGRLCTISRVENPAKALDYCRRASEIEPTNVNHAVGFGAALVQTKQYDNAAAIFKRILQIAPDNYTAHANLATALFQSKRYAEAINEYQWLTEKQPNLAIGYYFLAISHDNLEQYIDALANYQQFLKIASEAENKLEIEKVNLRLPGLQKQVKKVKGKR
ncbi:MAG: tetratricopeptide repeat protein [Pyrinomonadaceae bacterium]|nr:tetratricopeptide repeat protein [Pyrinomonadaceae bacterium]